MPEVVDRFDSVGIGGVLHCLPGACATRAACSTRSGRSRSGAKIFGCSLIADRGRRRTRGDFVLRILNRLRVVDNADDRSDDLLRELASRFEDCQVERVGYLVFFSAVVK